MIEAEHQSKSTLFSWQRADGTQFHAQKWIPTTPTKAVIALVHGLGEHSGRYQYVANYLTQQGYLVMAFDLRGHGKSSGQRAYSPSYDVLLDDIAQFLQICNDQYPQFSQFLYGHSFGGNLVINYILRRQPQLQGVIVTSPSLVTAFKPPVWKLWLGKLMYHLFPRLTLSSGINRKHSSKEPAVSDEDLEVRALMHNKITARLGIDVINSGMWALQHASDFHLPLLLMHGSEDRITSVDATHEFAEQVGDLCSLKIWDDLYHEIHHESDRDKVLEYLTAWLGTHTS